MPVDSLDPPAESERREDWEVMGVPGGVIAVIEGDGGGFRALRRLPLALGLSEQGETVTELMLCGEGWGALGGGEESRPTVLRALEGKGSTGLKVMVRC